MATIEVGLLGCGVVGREVARLLLLRAETYGRRAGVEPRLAAIAVRDPARDRGLPRELFRSPAAVAQDPAIRVVIEVMGGVEPARTLILQALGRGAHVVTANKELIAHHGRELFAAAHQSGAILAYEAAVAGGIPIIATLKRGLAANTLLGLEGIINGTTNYLLTRMRQDGLAFEAALAEAQEAGYAEADPTADIDGHDAAHKLALLASLVLGARVPAPAIFREGVRRLTPRDLAYAAELGYEVKLLGIARRTERGLEARVHPTMIPGTHPLARVDGVTNAITVYGDPVGAVTLAGPGAGGGATASAVVADLLDVLEQDACVRPSRLMADAATLATNLVPMGDLEQAYYLRLIAADVPGVLGALGTVFGDEGVSIRSFVQKDVVEARAELVFVTHRVREAAFMQALARIRALAAVHEVATLIRVEEAL